MKVGITISIDDKLSIFSNGLTQNVLMFYDLVQQIDIITKVSLVDVVRSRKIEEYQNYPYLEGYDITIWDDNTISEEFDVLVIFGISPSVKSLKLFKSNSQNKVVAYKGGNVAVMQMESLIFSQRSRDINKKTESMPIIDTGKTLDEVWMVPQQEFHNTDIFEIQNYTKARTVPFIWSSKFIDQTILEIKEQIPGFMPFFDERSSNIEKWRVATTEPNSSVLKNMYPLIHIFEWAYRKEPELFEKFIITNASEFSKNEFLIKFIYEFEFYHSKKLKLGPRWSIVKLLSEEADMIISHQWGNPLNYAYLDTVYLGYPLVHNAELCQDIGYYYKDWQLKDAGDLIIKAAGFRKLDENYAERHRNILKRYTLDNKIMINQYRDLFSNLWSNNLGKLKYNWKTNLLQ